MVELLYEITGRGIADKSLQEADRNIGHLEQGNNGFVNILEMD